MINEIKIYNYAITSIHVRDLYNGDAALIDVPLIRPADLIIYWHTKRGKKKGEVSAL